MGSQGLEFRVEDLGWLPGLGFRLGTAPSQ